MGPVFERPRGYSDGDLEGSQDLGDEAERMSTRAV